MKTLFTLLLLVSVASAATYDYPVKTTMNPPTANRAATTDANGKLAVSSVTTNELGFVSGVTSALQTQLNSKGAATNGIYSGGTFTTATNSGATYFGSAWVTNSATATLQLNSNLTAFGALRLGPNSGNWTLNAGDSAVEQQLYVGGAGINSGYMAAFNIQSRFVGASPGEITYDILDGTARNLLYTFRANGTRVGYVGWSGSSSTNNRTMIFNEDHGDGMGFQIGSGGGQNGFRWYGGANARYLMKLHPALGGLSIGSSFYSTSPPTNGLLVEGTVGFGVSNPQYSLDVGGAMRTVGTNSHWFGGTSGAADATVSLSQSAANILTVTASTRVETTGNLNVGFTGSGAATFHVKSSSSAPAIIQQTASPTGDQFATRDSSGVNHSGVDTLWYLFQSTGNSTNRNRATGTVKTDTSSIANVGTSETNLMTYTFPAAGLNATGDSLVYEAFGTTAANVNSKTVKCYFGGTLLATSGAFTTSGAAWNVRARIVRTGAATQIAICTITVNGATTDTTTYSAPTETLSGTVVVKCTGTSATASSDITQLFHTVKFEPAN